MNYVLPYEDNKRDKLTGIFHVASRDLTTPHELISHYIGLARHLSRFLLLRKDRSR